jgi:hypothetical protein
MRTDQWFCHGPLPTHTVCRHGETRWHDTGVRPGAPCMECGDYPGARHDASDCARATQVAR